MIDNFNTLDKRADIGQLWENFVICERLKYREYHRIFATQYFWRTYDGSEIDLVEERDGKIFGFEIKYKSSNVRVPAKWNEYDTSEFQLINKDKLQGFVY